MENKTHPTSELIEKGLYPLVPIVAHGRNFLAFLSASEAGFTVTTDKILGRTEGTSGYALEVAGDSEATKDNKTKLGAATRGESAFQEAAKVRAARQRMRLAKTARMTGAPPDVIANLDSEAQEAKEAFEAERHRYTEGMHGKVGTAPLSIDPETNAVVANIRSIPFSNVNAFSDSSNENLRKISSASGTAMIVITADGKIILQHRSTRNAAYGDVPGASAAGWFDVTLDSPDRQKGKPDPVTTDSVIANVVKEVDEELGISKADLSRIRITGVAQDLVKPHDEFLLLAESTLTFEAIKANARDASKNESLGDADFEEKFIAIDGTAEAIETFLSQSLCPIPSTHEAAFFAAGYLLVLQKKGVRAAYEWKQRVARQIYAKNEEIDKIVEAYYETNPQEYDRVPDRLQGKDGPPRNRHGYSPAYLPEEQGLPTFERGMQRVFGNKIEE